MKRLALTAAFLLAFGSAESQEKSKAPSAPKVFRCTDSKGGIIYTDKPELNCKILQQLHNRNGWKQMDLAAGQVHLSLVSTQEDTTAYL